ncbi:MAG: cation diffusion facilitator family transporter [candidate division WOR-3 bacterium]
MGDEKRVSKIVSLGVIINALLFVLKGAAWFGTHSLGILSDTVNSGTDILLYAVMVIVALWSRKRADADHPFGHTRAEPLGAIVVAIFVAMVALEIVRGSVEGLISRHAPRITAMAICVLAVSVITKGFLGPFFMIWARRTRSPLLKSTALDAFADIGASGVALLGLVLSGIWDALAGAAVGVWVLVSAFSVMRENLSYLMGKAPNQGIIMKIRRLAGETPGVASVTEVRAHYVGAELHVEVIITVSPEISVREAHDIGAAVQERVESAEEVSRAFVHVDA